MKEQLISFETAVLAKEREFKWNNEYMHFTLLDNNVYPEGELFLKPTQSLLQKWLRDEHNIHIYIEPSWVGGSNTDIEAKPYYTPWVVYNFEEDTAPDYFDTYEEALEDGLKDALSLITVQ